MQEVHGHPQKVVRAPGNSGHPRCVRLPSPPQASALVAAALRLLGIKAAPPGRAFAGRSCRRFVRAAVSSRGEWTAGFRRGVCIRAAEVGSFDPRHERAKGRFNRDGSPAQNAARLAQTIPPKRRSFGCNLRGDRISCGCGHRAHGSLVRGSQADPGEQDRRQTLTALAFLVARGGMAGRSGLDCAQFDMRAPRRKAVG